MNLRTFRGLSPLLILLLSCVASSLAADFHNDRAFYVAADPGYTIVDSVLDSLRFALNKTLKADSRGHLVSISSFVNPQGEVMGWHDFGNLEGPGWAANAVGGAWEIYRWAWS